MRYSLAYLFNETNFSSTMVAEVGGNKGITFPLYCRDKRIQTKPLMQDWAKMLMSSICNIKTITTDSLARWSWRWGCGWIKEVFGLLAVLDVLMAGGGSDCFQSTGGDRNYYPGSLTSLGKPATNDGSSEPKGKRTSWPVRGDLW